MTTSGTGVLQGALRAVLGGEDLSRESMEAAMEAILDGAAEPALMAGLAIALRMKGETAEEIAAAARVMRARCERVVLDVEGPLLDTAGTGGDGVGSFNLSTISAIVAAAAGVRVAKHGNRAVSSRSGSADVLEALGIELGAAPALLQRSVQEVGIAFFFAPAHHAALRHAAPVRRALGVRTFFNLLGPLSNPAGATHQILGVYDGARVVQMAECLGLLGLERAWVVHGHGGLDEISPAGPTLVAELRDGAVRSFEVGPADFGLEPSSLDSIGGGDAKENAALTQRLFAGEALPVRTAVLLNSAAAILVASAETDPQIATERAREAIDSGAAGDLLRRWVALGGSPQ